MNVRTLRCHHYRTARGRPRGIILYTVGPITTSDPITHKQPNVNGAAPDARYLASKNTVGAGAPEPLGAPGTPPAARRGAPGQPRCARPLTGEPCLNGADRPAVAGVPPLLCDDAGSARGHLAPGGGAVAGSGPQLPG
ncbi:hypothetical protein NDU88_002017 [Pleurodeles waltl]|uniref:Uncharacterized protein n=1 Tax=Pleurodeles waltl TaxID=8319 RepID=A0AAV7P5I1_PLEWA|nr:hypothetical protein NDU88_002017 [Pleurodeles waltl]